MDTYFVIIKTHTYRRVRLSSALQIFGDRNQAFEIVKLPWFWWSVMLRNHQCKPLIWYLMSPIKVHLWDYDFISLTRKACGSGKNIRHFFSPTVLSSEKVPSIFDENSTEFHFSVMFHSNVGGFFKIHLTFSIMGHLKITTFNTWNPKDKKCQ